MEDGMDDNSETTESNVSPTPGISTDKKVA